MDPVIQDPQQENVDITLRRFTRKGRPAISFDYVVYLQEYDIDIGVEDDPITFSQVMGESESTLWYNSMKDEMISKAKIKFGILLSCLKVQRSLVVNGFLRLKETSQAILKYIRQDLWLKDQLNKKELIIMIPSLMFQRRIHFR